LNCIWDLSGLNNADFSHFELNNGRFICEDMIVSSFDISNLKFFKSTNNMFISCNNLLFKGIKTSLTDSHFTFVGGESNFTDSVLSFFFIYFNFSNRYLKILKEK
jgi:hypothetical protein